MKSEQISDAVNRKSALHSESLRPDPYRVENLAALGSSDCTDSAADHALTDSLTDRITQSLRKATTLAELTRLSGAALIVFALSLFLMQGVDASNDLQRYHLLLLQTSLLGAAGFAVGFLLKEPRGARVFFSLGLISIPANLAVLGAMVYSIMPSSHLTQHYPDYASWQASNLTEIIIALVTGLIVLVPTALFAFSVLARQSRGWLTCGYLLSSSMLLLPIRDSISIAIISSMVAICMMALIRHRRPETAILTVEERFSRVLLFVPAVLMVGRSAVLYSGDFHTVLMVCAATYFLLRQWSAHCTKSTLWSNSLHGITAVSAVVLAVMLCTLDVGGSYLPGPTILFTVVLGGLLLEFSRTVSSDSIRWWMHTGWALLCIPAFVGNILFWSGASAFVFSVLVSIIMTGSGFALRNKLVIFLGALSITGNVLMQAGHVVQILLESNWMTVALFGAVVVISGSLIERYGVVMKLKWVALARHRQSPAGGTDQRLDSEEPETPVADDSGKGLAA